jgi:hypothetical protein
MKARCLRFGTLAVLTAAFLIGGCQQVDPLRQGVVKSTYSQELRDLALETSRKGLSKSSDQTEQAAEAIPEATADITLANHWQVPSLLSAVHLQPPVPLEFGVPGPPPRSP